MGSSKQVKLEQASSVVLIPLALVDESPSNTRKTFNEVKLAELAASIRVHGIQQPVTVRKSGDRFELVFGHRRARAAREAGLSAIPAQVKELADKEVRELQLVENNQRDDVDPLEEADGYRELVEKFGYTVEDLAAKTGKSKAFILARLALCHLCREARTAYAKGALELYGAIAIARIPDLAVQAEATKAVTRFGEPMSPRQVRDVIERQYMLRLKDAPFNIADAGLVAAAGSCNACPKRTGNQPELFSDASRKDLCTDSACYGAKTEAAWTKRLEAALAKGHEILDDEACAKLYPYSYGGLVQGSEFLDLADACHEDPKARTWGAVLGSVKPPIYLARDKAGRAHQLVRKDDVKALLKQSNNPVAKAAAKATRTSDSLQVQQRKQRKANELRRATVSKGMAQIVAAVQTRPVDEALWRYIAASFLRGSWSDTIRDVAKRRGLMQKGSHPAEVLEASMKDMGAAELAALTVECLATRFATPSYGTGYGEPFTEACALFGLDVKALEKAAAEEAEANKSSGGKGRKKAPAAADEVLDAEASDADDVDDADEERDAA